MFTRQTVRPNFQPDSVVLADLDGDGRLDVAISGNRPGVVAVYHNNGDHSFSLSGTYAVGSSALALSAGDFNGDHAMDLAGVDSVAGKVFVLTNSGRGSFGSAYTLDLGGSGTDIAAGDLNGDGYDDLVVSSNLGGRVSSFLSSRTGFGARTDYSADSPMGVLLADLNGDGVLDVTTALYGSYRLQVMLNPGAGLLSSGVTYGVQSGPRHLAAMDFDGSGTTDLVVMTYFSQGVSILRGRGNGSFLGRDDFVIGGDVVDVVAADFNGDGRPDLAVTRMTEGDVVVMLNTGAWTSPANPMGRISGTLWEDSDMDATRDAGESPLQGWSVYADLNGNGIFDASEPYGVTDATGAYVISGLDAGQYAVRPDLPQGWQTSSPAMGYRSTYVSWDQQSAGQDLGVFQLGSVAGGIWDDLDRDGVWDAGEPGLSGWTVYADTNYNGSLNTGEPFAVTDASGHYTISGLVPKTYRIRVSPQDNWAVSVPPGGTQDVAVASGQVARNVNFAAVAAAGIYGAVWSDLNGNGIRDAGEPMLTGRTVFLDADNDGVLDTGEVSKATGADGTYVFTNLAPGAYVVRVAGVSGWLTSAPLSSCYTVSLAAGEARRDIDFGSAAVVSVSGAVWNDRDGDAYRDGNDAGLAGIVVTLRSDAGVSLQAATDAAGNYSFSGLLPGSFTVSADLGTERAATTPLGGSYSIVLSAGTTRMGLDFGTVPSAQLTGFVWDDLNADGVRADGEPGLSGWLVYADLDLDGMRDASEPVATVAANGSYLLAGLLGGSYRVQVEAPAGWVRSAPGQEWIEVSVAAGQNLVAGDFGYYHSAGISGRVFADTNGNGLLDAGESGLAGRRVYIDANGNDRYDAGELETTSAADGSYAFPSLSPGTYRVRHEMPAADPGTDPTGWGTTTPSGGTYVLTLLSGSAPGELLFGERQLMASVQVALSQGQTVMDDQASPIDFGVVEGGLGGRDIIFTVTNTGNWPLKPGTLSIPEGYVLVKGLSSSIGPGAADTFTLRLAADRLGQCAGAVCLATNDPSHPTFDFSVTGSVLDTTAPLATAQGLQNLLVGGGTRYEFSVVYEDGISVAGDTLGDGDVVVRGPNGFEVAPTAEVLDGTDGSPRTVYYRFDAPGGSWSQDDGGDYRVYLLPGQVADTSGNTAGAETLLGTFVVDLTGDAYEDDNTPNRATPISTDGKSQTHSLHIPGDTDWFTFNLTFSSTIQITTNGLSGDTVLRLYGPDAPGRLIAEDDDGNGTFSRIIMDGAQSLQAGQYWIEVSEFGGDGTVRPYIISVSRVVDTSAPTPSLQASDVTLAQAGQREYRFRVNFDDFYSLDAAALNAAQLTVLGPNGYSGAARVVSTTSNGYREYAITPPGGSWDTSDHGVYTVVLPEASIVDNYGNYVAGGPVGTFRVTMGTAAPDLIVSELKVISADIATGRVEVQATVRNQGDAAAASDFSVGFLMSKDTVWDCSDRLAGSVHAGVLGLGVGQTTTVLATLEVEHAERWEGAWLIAVADLNGGSQVAESDEANNARAVGVFTTPTLKLTGLSRDVMSASDAPLDLGWVAWNAPAGATVSLYFDRDATFSNGTAGLIAGQTISASGVASGHTAATLAGLTLGEGYYVHLVLDDGSREVVATSAGCVTPARMVNLTGSSANVDVIAVLLGDDTAASIQSKIQVKLAANGLDISSITMKGGFGPLGLIVRGRTGTPTVGKVTNTDPLNDRVAFLWLDTANTSLVKIKGGLSGLAGMDGSQIRYLDGTRRPTTGVLYAGGAAGDRLACVVGGNLKTLDLDGIVQGNLSVTGDVSAITMRQAFDAGTIRVGGSLGSYTQKIGDLGGGASLEVGGSVKSLTVGGNIDGAIDVGGSLARLTVGGSVTGTGAKDSPDGGGSAASIRVGGDLLSLTVKSALSGCVQVSGQLSRATVASVSGGLVSVAGDVSSVTVKGDIDQSSIVARTIGSVTANGDVSASQIVAGYGNASTFVGGTIQKVCVKGSLTGSQVVAGLAAGDDGQWGTSDDVAAGIRATLGRIDVSQSVEDSVIQSVLGPLTLKVGRTQYVVSAPSQESPVAGSTVRVLQ